MHKKRILIVEDDKDLARLLAHRCRTLGLHSAIAYDALTALNRLNEFQPHAVVLDVGLPAGNGLSVCEMMMTDDNWQSIPKIILTGRQDDVTIRRCHELYALYIPKSEDVWDELRALLILLLELPSQSAGPAQFTPGTEIPACEGGLTCRAAEAPPFDLQELLARCEGDAQFVAGLIHKFQQQAPDACGNLAESIAHANCADAQDVAHRLKGAAMYVSANNIRDAAATLELFASVSDLTNMAIVLESLEDHVMKCIQWDDIPSTFATV